MRAGRCHPFLFALAGALLLAGAVLPARSQESPYVLHVDSDEVLVDLFAVDHTTFRPDATLTAADITVLNDGKAVHITSLTHSGAGSLRPLAVFVITQCDLTGWTDSGSKFVQGRSSFIAAGLQQLGQEDSAAAAGWCDDGRHLVNTLGHAADAVSRDTESWITPSKAPKGTGRRQGELALQAMLRDISMAVSKLRPRTLPVLIFLHQDDTGTGNEEYRATRRILLEQSSVCFDVTDGHGKYQPSAGYMQQNTPWVLRTLANDTGGAGYATPDLARQPNGIGDVIATIVDQLHGRYQVSFVPPARDGAVHQIAVQLSDAGHAHHGGVALRARTTYLAPAR